MKTGWSAARIAVVIAIVAVLAVMSGAVLLFSRYVHTRDIDAAGAAREFEAARARFAGQVPLLEYREQDAPIVHRRSGERHQLVALHAIVYDADEEYLRRVDIPFGVLRLVTAGGRLGLVSLGGFGTSRDRMTLDDLERHGPGLVVDAGGGAVGALVAGDALLGTHSRESRILMWTE